MKSASPIRRALAVQLAAAGLWLLSACAALTRQPPRAPPPLFDLEEPLELVPEPQDEDARAALAFGAFSGIDVGDARRSLDELLTEPTGVLVVGVVENSPADVAGIEVDDLVLEARAQGRTLALKWPSEWRALELATPPGSQVVVVCDRAGVEREAQLTLVARVHPRARAASERFKEEQHAGVVVRSATEVEARAAGLGPGGGAVVVGLARSSPWRKDGVRYLDLIRAVDGQAVADPHALLEAIRAHAAREKLTLEIVRGAETLRIDARLSQRSSELDHVSIPLLYDYENDRGHKTTSVLLGLFNYESTPAAWKVRLLWFISFGGGDADRLQEVHR